MKTSQWRRAVENRCVFSARLKALSDGSGDRSAGGRRFHVAGPVTCKTSLSSCSGTSREPVAADRSDGSSGYAEIAEISWSDTMSTLPDRQRMLVSEYSASK